MFSTTAFHIASMSESEILAFIAAEDRDVYAWTGESAWSCLLGYRGPDEDGIVTVLTGAMRGGQACLELGAIVRLGDGRVVDRDHAFRDPDGQWRSLANTAEDKGPTVTYSRR